MDGRVYEDELIDGWNGHRWRNGSGLGVDGVDGEWDQGWVVMGLTETGIRFES